MEMSRGESAYAKATARREGKHIGLPLQLDIFDALSMDTESQQVLHLIRERVGRQSAISVGLISETTGIPPRTVRAITKNLIERHRIRIGSSLGNPPGYYIIETQEEAEQNERTLRKLGISILVRAAALKKITVREYMRQLQGELPLSTFAKASADRPNGK